MPHATKNGENDDLDFENVLAQINAPNGEQFDFMGRDLETGEKADDAIDFEDFDDDDLPEEEDGTGASATQVMSVQPDGIEQDDLWSGDLFGDDEAPAGTEARDEVDDLFGDGASSPPAELGDAANDLFLEKGAAGDIPVDSTLAPLESAADEDGDIDLFGEVEEPVSPAEEDMDPATFNAWREQQALFARSAAAAVPGPDNIPAPPENDEDLLKSLWPNFDRDSFPRFVELFRHKKAHYLGKQPAKPPRTVVPTKIHLEFCVDQERVFNTGGQGNKRAFDSENAGVLAIQQVEDVEIEREENLEALFDDNEVLPGGVTMQDLHILCADWEVKSQVSEADIENEPAPRTVVADNLDEDTWFPDMEETQPFKRLKTGREPHELLKLSHIDIPILDDPALLTSQIAKKVVIDMNDPHLLLDNRPEALLQKPKTLPGPERGEMDINTTKRLNQRYNISNDDAYDMLKENHQNKIRSTLGSATLEHSMPALRLQWPYYKTELSTAEARSFHRPALSFRPMVSSWFKNSAYVKRKHHRGKDAKSLFNSTKSLSMADNSTMLLVEYAEEVPMMLSNFGMANRFVNYYRRKNAEDSTRPKAEIGETHVLLPQDKSPFSIFGHIDPGETTPAISNSMYRAPVFSHQPQSTDFLVIRNSNQSDGSDFYMKNIENLYVAGQQLPTTDVPGPHSRKVTTVAKNRLKMLTFRLMKREGNMQVSIHQVTAHLPGSSDMQNRQKMKDFVHHDKDTKMWVPIGGIPDSETIRSWIQPEDVCLLESMQVGLQHLHDTGHSNSVEDEDDDAEGESFEQQMAPWRATRNFTMASQGKAMLKLHGDGDPTSRGLMFSFIKTSMKGGFQAIGESAQEKMEKREQKDTGGHSYNVARQQKAYESSIRHIWNAQKASLSSQAELSESDHEDLEREDEDEFNRPTPREVATPSIRRDDESMSQFSRLSSRSQRGKVLRIVRDFKDENGNIYQKEQLVWDPRVIRKYVQIRHQVEAVNTQLAELLPTGDPEVDARNKKLLEAELTRLNRNKERRFAREKQKGAGRMSVGDFEEAGTPSKAGGSTTRKCASCGMVGHIKTNKKLCPKLNGSAPPDEGLNDSAFAVAATPTF
ncbi:putative transcription factor TFIID complex 145 kDa subunit [Talaromyces proteolyticus]|uniref:Transcription factor TFIID complex 145 kDa subunit n=1 Tax=Talaromyces proteolyticus TaxID=1131652 RepID=A0AAD4L1H8_9EURO|nr:putative transcription factor TFIID complex 145 kDa subunit [Talaromyces proteolyticus]KAH8704886.1 putative transcription factor TFIID complex 145 kDa subunit [Talaromyces proteolyticus]